MTFGPRHALALLAFAAPAVVVYGAGALCPMDKSEAKKPHVPPGWVFAVVWPLLLAALGGAWARAVLDDKAPVAAHLAYVALTLGLGAWPILYSCGRKRMWASVLLVGCLAVALLIALTAQDAWQRVLLAPLVAWLVFAMTLNTKNANDGSA